MTNLQIAELSGLAEGVVRAFLYGHRLVDASNVSIIAEAVGYTEAEQAVLAGQYTSAIRIRRQADIQSGKLMDDGIYAPASAAEAFLVAMKLGLPVSDIDVGQNPSAQTVLNVLREKPTTTPTTIARRHGLSAKEVRDALELVTERILDMYPALEPFIQRLRREDDPDGSRPLTGKGEVLPEVRAAYQAFGIDVDTLPVSLRKSAPELEQLPELVALAASDSDPQTILTGLSAAIPKGRTLRHYAPGSLVDDEVDNLLLDPALSNPDIVRISGLPLRSVNTLRKRMTAELARRITDVRTTGVHSAAAHDLSEPLDATAPSKIAQMAVYMKRYEIPLAGIFTVRQLAMYRMCIDPRMSREMLMERLRMTSEQFDTLESQFVEKMTLALQARLRGEL